MAIDDHMGIAFAGLASDSRVLRYSRRPIFFNDGSNYMRTQAMQSKMMFNRPLPVYRIASQLADKAQLNTHRYSNRPYGVGLLIIGQDVAYCFVTTNLCQETGPHLYEFSPAGNSFDCYAMSIGSRSQSAKTYLEKHFASFAEGAFCSY